MFSILTLGCKVNSYESEFIKETLISNGFVYNEDYKNSDIVILNTCSVTNKADIKSKKLLRRIKRENDKCILVVCGCSVQNNPEEYKMIGADILLGNTQKSKIVDLIKAFIETKKIYFCVDQNRKLDFETMRVDKFTSHTRAFIKIQDGCDNFCSYCIIPFVRGSIRSKDFNEVVKEAETLSNNGHSEIVLTGIHTGSYNSNGKDLTDLIQELSKLENLKLIRISSIEITELNNKFLMELKTNKKIADHLHIPLQAGSNEVLKLMNRKYDLEFYEAKIKKIREIRPNISITTDVIVGFPNETDELFCKSYEFCQKIKFAKIHVFPYSVRTGTKASMMSGQQTESCKKMRSEKLGELSTQLEHNYAISYLDKNIEVIVEEVFEGYSLGHSSNYLAIRIYEVLLKNNIYNIKVVKVENDIIKGVVNK